MVWEDEFERTSGGGPSTSGSEGARDVFSFTASLFPLRSLALDAQVIDDGLVQQLRTEFSRAAALLPPRAVLKVRAETQLVLELAVLALTVGLGRPTPGMEMLSLKYQKELSPLQRVLLCTVGPGSRWLTERFETLASSRDMAGAEGGWEALAWRAYWLASLSASVLKTVNLCLFFREGRYVSLTERALGVTKTYEDPRIIRSAALGFMDDHLFWINLYDFVTDMTPLATTGLRRLKHFGTSLAGKARRFGSKRLAALGWGAEAGGEAAEGGSRDHVEGRAVSCGICGRESVASLSYAHPCGCPHCYYCLATHLATVGDLSCKTCGRKVQGIAR
ncbi:peroxisome biogenesis factor 2 domain-containing protein [Chloropicon primus]|uniref:RING-type E3 ubiquitin transferase (cysteine targeting) n=2 Tax=Chloropicon primus TaxID=1764295 RepID=A0A5B8MHJ7_9CHLO|nr:hypothetical protein A3770_03p24250 [Chloropicon primus]UPQ99118.1 peroxisome biogenesis factor 2 domain-containing protein [Chloropicon primus]|eukprot:QDZ19907.1 hypothetical protein A3770_03p24250 [Chloropicon primus]